MDIDTFQEVKNRSLRTLVRDHLIDRIMDGSLEPGQALREPELVEQLQVSRAPVREAKRELESIGLVVSRKHAGVYIRALGDKEVSDLYALRGALDRHAGEMAARLPHAERLALAALLQADCEAMDQAIAAEDGHGYYEANLRFHWRFIEASGNDEIAKTYREAVRKLHLARVKNLSTQAHRRQSNHEHRLIADALRQPMPAAAPHAFAAMLADHVESAHARLAALPR